MPVTLRDSLSPLVLRDSARYAPSQAQGANFFEAQDTNPLTRGWNATGEGLVASQLLAEANAAERKGDTGLSQALQLRAQDHMQQAQTWAPTTQNFDEINSLGSGAEWLAGSVGGGLRSMIAPVAGGALGSLAGGAVGMLTRNPGLGARAAQVLAPAGAFVPGYDMAYNETVGQAMMDPEVRARSSAQDIHNTGQVAGAVSGALDAIVPAGVAKVAVGGMGKRLAGRTIAKDMVEEGVTEGAQNLVGQTAQNQLRGDDLTNYDYRSTFNDAMAGAVAGGAISAGGVGVGKLRDKIAAGGEAVADTARDPVGKVIEAMKARAEKQGREQAQQEIAAGNTPLEKMFQQSAEQAASDRFFDPAPKDATDEEVSASARASADQWADKILSSQPRTFGPREGALREAAAQYKSDGDWLKFRAVLKENNLRTTQDEMAASFDTGEKASEMTPEGKELDALSKAWLSNEGKRFGEYFDGSDEANGLGAKMFAWIKSDFGKKLTENGEIFIPRAFIEALGDRAPGVVESAVTAARKEGWDIRDAGDAVKAIRDYVSSNEGDFGFLNSAIRYSQQNNWTPKMVRQFAKELRQKSGQLNKDDYRWFKTQVGDIVSVLEHFQKPSKYYKAEKNMGLKSDAGLTQAARDQDEKVGVTENDGDWSSGVSEKEPVSKRDYLQEDEFFDIRDPDQRAVMEKMSADAAAVRTQSGDAKRVVRVGILDRYLEKAAEERGVAPDALAPQTRDKITRDLVHEYFPSFERLPPAPKNVSTLTEKQYRERKSQYETGLKRRANLLNQKLVTLAVESVGMEKLGTQIAARDVHMKNANPTDPKYGAHRGTIILRTYTKDGKVASRPFVTSTQMIISKMFKASDSAGASTKRYEGTAQEMLQLLSDGITSVLQDKRFGGEGKKMRIGTLRNGEPQWFDGSDIRAWPKNLVIFRDKAMRPYTLGEALEQEKLQSKNTLSFDYDPEENDPGRNDKVREKAPWEMRQELKTLLNNEADKPVRAKIIQALRAKDEVGNRNDQPVIYLWNELVESGKLKSSDTVTELGSTRGNMIEEGQVGPDTLAAYDPDYIKRDERGDMLSSSVEYTAQSRIGTSKSVEPKDSKKFDPATKAMPGLRKGSGVEIRMEEAKQRFVDLMRNGVQTVLDSVATMAPKDLALFETAFAEFAKLSSANVDALAKEYFQGDKNAARMFTTRLMRSNVAIRDAIDARGEVNKNGQLPGSKEKANGEARQADSAGTEAGVVAQPGRGRTTKDGELGAGQQGRNAEDGVAQNLVDIAKPPAFAREKEQAKLDGADYVFAPTGVDGSFASRLAEAAKVAGKLIDPNGTENIRDKVVYVSVPGAGRGFAGMDAFLADVRKLLDRGAVLRTDTKDRASTPHNAAGEGKLRQMLAFGNYVLTEGKLFDSWQKNLPRAKQPDTKQVKQDAWVMKVASLPRKDLKAFVNALPKEKLKRAFDVLESFFPVDNTNPFWQRNDLDNYTDAKSDTVFEAQELIRDRLSEDGVKASEQNTIKTWDTIKPGDVVTLYRGENSANDKDGQWWTTDKGKAARYGTVREVTLSAEDIGKHAARGHNGADEFVFTNKRPDELTQIVATSNQTIDQPIDPKQALEDLARMLGKDYDAEVVKNLGGKAGMWTKSGIKLATSAANGTQYHEALHEMFSQMREHGADNVRELIERVASSPLIMRKLEQLLEGHPKAIKQLKTPEEAAAFLFQFWNMGLINVGPETKSLFQTVKDWVANVAKDLYAAVNAGAREKRAGEKAAKMDQAEVRRLFEGLAAGGVANPDTRAAVYDALRKNAEAHQKAIDELGQRAEKFWRGMGKYVVTSETMLNLYSKHPELKNLIADRFHQMAGKSMKNQARDASLTARGGYIEAVHGETQRRLTKFERFLMDTKFDQKDMELAAKHLEANTQSSDKKIQSLIDFVHDYYGEMYDYATQSDVRRLDPNHPDRWVPLQKRKNYFTQSWSIEELSKDHDGFVSTLLDKHRTELEGMAKQANAELVAWNKNPKVKVQSPTAKNEVERAIAEFEQSGQIVGKLGINPVTPEMIAETIYTRLLNSTGLVDIQESEWSLGITPAAAAVNRRELDWLDKEAFSKYKSKDLVEIVTSYTRTMVKRAEYQKRFGYSGEVIAEAMDTAFLREMGGDKLVDDASTALLSAISSWKKAYAEFKAENPDATFPEPYPTLRMVGVAMHRSQVGEDKANADMVAAEKTLRPAINAVRAMEGTLGNEIGQGMRSFNSWVNTYQNVRLLPLALFTNFSDVIGVTVQGGTLGDAWDAFTAGIREVRNTWVNEKGEDKRTMRAEEWGVSDAGALLDTLGQNYSSVYMNEKARAVNNTFFRAIGMEGWNRGVRITASAVGERVIMNWVSNGVDAKKPGEQARFERLYGEGFDLKSIKLDKDGNLDTSDAANRAAIQRFVQDAVMSSNPAVRATWMSDPRMATFAHLKNFAYAFHSVMLKGILAQVAQGNLRPALVAGLGYASISIAAGAIKEMLIPGDEPFWMQGGLDGYLEYGYGQANLGGVPQLWFDGVAQLDPAKLAGPFWDQIQNTLSAPLPGLKLNLSPMDGETDIISDRKLAVELAKALPAGNLAGRAMDSLIGE